MKLGIVGAGMIVKEFLSITPYLKELELTALYGRKSSEDKMKGLQDEYGIKNLCFNYDELLESDVDTVYIALPNHLHFEFAKKALNAGKNTIIEKPMTSAYQEALLLSNMAKERGIFLLEAITTQYLPNYKKIRDLVPTLGDIKIVQCNYSQYSSRYDCFQEGKVMPAFDPACSGGALMDLNVYNIHYAVGLFGKPKGVEYYPNMERGIDTSGILILVYDGFQCVCIGAKDCKAPIANNIQGNKGCLYQDNPTNTCERFELRMNDGSGFVVNENQYSHRMVNEFLEFAEMIDHKNLEKCYNMLDCSLIVSEVLTIARKKSGIVFPSDQGESAS